MRSDYLFSHEEGVIITNTSSKVNSINIKEKDDGNLKEYKKCIISNNFEVDNTIQNTISFVMTEKNGKRSNNNSEGEVSRKKYFFDKFFVIGVEKENSEISNLEAENYYTNSSVLYEYPPQQEYEAHYTKIIQDFIFSQGVNLEKIDLGKSYGKINEFILYLLFYTFVILFTY